MKETLIEQVLEKGILLLGQYMFDTIIDFDKLIQTEQIAIKELVGLILRFLFYIALSDLKQGLFQRF